MLLQGIVVSGVLVHCPCHGARHPELQNLCQWGNTSETEFPEIREGNVCTSILEPHLNVTEREIVIEKSAESSESSSANAALSK